MLSVVVAERDCVIWSEYWVWLWHREREREREREMAWWNECLVWLWQRAQVGVSAECGWGIERECRLE